MFEGYNNLPMGLSKIVETLGTLKKVARHYDCSYLSAILRFLKLYCLERYTRAEIFPSQDRS